MFRVFAICGLSLVLVGSYWSLAAARDREQAGSPAGISGGQIDAADNTVKIEDKAEKKAAQKAEKAAKKAEKAAKKAAQKAEKAAKKAEKEGGDAKGQFAGDLSGDDLGHFNATFEKGKIEISGSFSKAGVFNAKGSISSAGQFTAKTEEGDISLQGALNESGLVLGGWKNQYGSGVLAGSVWDY